MLAVLLPCRGHFYRRGAMLTERFTLRWFIAIGMVLACAAWLMLFAFKHVEYRDELWWQFAFHGSAASLAASLGWCHGGDLHLRLLAVAASACPTALVAG